MALFGLPHGAVTFQATGEGLRIEGDPYGRFLKKDQLRLSEARAIDFTANPEFTPTLRTNGIGLPGYQSGWFNTQGAGKALVFLADRSHAVVIPTTLGYSLIFSPESPLNLISDLNKTFGEFDPQPLATDDPDGVPPGLWTVWVVLFAVPLPLAVLIPALAFLSRRVVFELTPEALRIRGSFFGRSIPTAKLRLDQARIVDLTRGPDRMTLIRTGGVGLPGYLAGWCKAFRHEGRFLIFLTDRTRAVLIPTTDGYTLLISPAATELFLEALTAPAPTWT
jgi:Bacterial PH domain